MYTVSIISAIFLVATFGYFMSEDQEEKEEKREYFGINITLALLLPLLT